MSLSNAQYNAIIRQYEAKQLENQHISEERTQYVYHELPRLLELDKAIASISVAQAKKLIEGDDSALVQLRDMLQALISEKNELLHSHGYSNNYFEPPYNCPDCKDTGYIGNKKCHCFKQASIDYVYTQSNIANILERENFSNFSYEFYSRTEQNPATGLSSYDTAKQAVGQCQTFIKEFDAAFDNLLFYGDTGIGKTFLSNCIARELLDAGRSVIYFTALELFGTFEKNKFKREESNKESYENIFDCDLLIIDDLGSELSNSFTNSQLFLCINQRILEQKSTIISTNLDLNHLADTYSERTFSRIFSYYNVIKLFGDDIRIQKKLRR